MNTQGNRLQDYIDHEVNAGGVYLPIHAYGELPHINTSSEYQTNFDSSVHALATTMFKNSVPSVAPASGVITTPSYTSTTSSVSITVPSYTFKFADGSTVTTSSGTISISSGLSSGPWYINIYSDSSGALHYDVPFTAATTTTNMDPVSDGKFPIYQNYPFTCTSSGSGGGTIKPPPTGGCPATNQLIETLEAGLIEARTLKVGMHLKDPVSGWNIINSLEINPTTIWRIETKDNIITHVGSIGPGEFVAIDCENHRYVLPSVADVNDTHAIMLVDGSWCVVTELKIGDHIMPLQGENVGQIGHNYTY